MVMQMALAIKCLSGLVSQWGCEPGGDRERQMGPSPRGGTEVGPVPMGGTEPPLQGGKKEEEKDRASGNETAL